MREAFIFIATTLLCLQTVFAQDTIELRGTVSDRQTGEPLVGVSIYTTSGNRFTASNLDGNYVFKVGKGDSIVFRCMGYRCDTMAATYLRKLHKMELTSQTVHLNEVEVTNFRDGYRLLMASVARIPQNYHCDTTIGTFFHRDCRTLNGEVYVFDEMVFDMLRVGYDKYHTIRRFSPDSDGRMIGSNYKAIRYDRLLVLDTAYVDSISHGVGGVAEYNDQSVMPDDLETPYMEDYVSHPKDFVYSVMQRTAADGHTQYILDIRSKVKKQNVGAGIKAKTTATIRMTIEYGTLAITQIEYTGSEVIDRFPLLLRPVMRNYGLDSLSTQRHSVARYDEVDGRHTLTSYTTHDRITISCRQGGKMGVERQEYDMVEQGVLTFQRRGDASFLLGGGILGTKTIGLGDRTVGEVIYDDAFWRRYNYVPMDAAMRKMLKRRLGEVLQSSVNDQ